MIQEDNFEYLVKECLKFNKKGKVYQKYYLDVNCEMMVDFENKKLIFPVEIVGRERNDGFDKPENFVVFECVDRLLTKGYRPEHIELEKAWHLGHDPKSGRADICIYNEDHSDMLAIIECKTYGKKYDEAYNDTLADGGQLFSYWQQEDKTKWLALYASDIDGREIKYKCPVISCVDDQNIIKLAQKDISVKLYKDAPTVEKKYEVWEETYDHREYDDLIFSDESRAYKIGIPPLRKGKLKDFNPDDKIVNKFEEILRHNNVSDKENAFNRLIALFICKLVDEISKDDDEVVDFQYRIGTDTYESLQDRLQRLHQKGMKEFMKEDIYYVSNDYAENLFKNYTGKQRKNAIEDLNQTIKILKFYSNNDFAFKDVHNEELFYQNGKILVEVVQLFEKYRIVYPGRHQFLGDLFEKLLNKGFKQNEGQFFTPIPITRFVWDSLPLRKIMSNGDGCKYPKVIDYACGAGHFLTEAIEAINYFASLDGKESDNIWVEKYIFGIEKDYRLARVSKVSMFMNGAGDANIIFGDGLENYPDKGIAELEFDILVANPPYAVEAFKPHLKLKNNKLAIVDRITNVGSEIETLFVERIAQLVKGRGYAAVILPNSILNKINPTSFIEAREVILKNFIVHAIVQCGGKTFNAATAETVILFLEKHAESPKKEKLAKDSVDGIFSGEDITEWEDKQIFEKYLEIIECYEKDYLSFIKREKDYIKWKENHYFSAYVEQFELLPWVKKKEEQKSFSALSPKEQLDWYNNSFYEHVHAKEREKLFYFSLVYDQRTLIVNAPSSVNDQKRFLGYDWKEGEGIQNINEGGMLYCPSDRESNGTISGLIRNHYEKKEIIEDGLKDYYCYKDLIDMIDFQTIDFYKRISLVMEELNVKSKKYRTKQLKKLMKKLTGVSITVKSSDYKTSGSIPVVSQERDKLISGYTNMKEKIDIGEVILFGDHTCAVKYIDFPFVRGADGTQLIKVDEDQIKTKFLYFFLKNAVIENANKYERHFKYVKDLWIPIPKLEEQTEIIRIFEESEKKIANKKEEIQSCKEEITQHFFEMFGERNNTVTISHYISSFIAGKSLAGIEECKNKVLKTSAVSSDYFREGEYKFLPKDYEPAEKDKINFGDVLISRMNTAELVGAVAYVWNQVEDTYIPDRLWKAVLKSNVNSIFLWQLLTQEDVKKSIKGIATGTSASMKNITQKNFLRIKVKDVSIDEQNEFSKFVSERIEKQRILFNELEELEREYLKIVEKYFR